MRIHPYQMQSFADGHRMRFQDRLAAYLEKHRKSPEQDARSLAIYAMNICDRLGLDREIDIANYGYRCVRIARDWAEQPHLKTFSAVLECRAIAPELRFSRMLQAEMAAGVDPFQSVPAAVPEFE